MQFIKDYYGNNANDDPLVSQYMNAFLKHYGNQDKYKDLNFDGG